VLCDCPEGVGVEVEVGQAQDDDEDLSTIESAVQAVEEAIGALTEELSSSGTEVAGLAERLAALEAAHAAEVAAREAEIAALRTDLAAANEQLAEVDARTAGAVVVSTYEVVCATVAGLGFEDTPILTRPYIYNHPDLGTVTAECVIAQVDPSDRPYLIVVDVIRDNVLMFPPYSYADSIARYGADVPGRYDLRTSFGNDINYEQTTVVGGFGGFVGLTESGDVVLSDSALPTIQNDVTVPDEPTRNELPLRVTILHDRAYSAPVYP
jgi:hypothetical protein